MKKILLMAIICLPLVAGAQERQLLLSGDAKISGFGAPVVRFTSIKDKSRVLVGGQGAVLINNRIYLGAGGGATTEDLGDGYSSFSYFGLLAGTFIKPSESLHYFLDLGIYTGNLSVGGRDLSSSGITDMEAEDFFFIEPGAGIALNISKSAKLTLGASYRFASSIDRDDLDADDLGGYAINVSVAFGKF